MFKKHVMAEIILKQKKIRRYDYTALQWIQPDIDLHRCLEREDCVVMLMIDNNLGCSTIKLVRIMRQWRLLAEIWRTQNNEKLHSPRCERISLRPVHRNIGRASLLHPLLLTLGRKSPYPYLNSERKFMFTSAIWVQHWKFEIRF